MWYFCCIDKYHKVFYHKLGNLQSEDVLVFKNDKYPLRNYYADITDDQSFLLLYETESTTGNALFIKNLKKKNAKFETIVDGFDNDYTVIDDYKGQLYVLTNYEAPKYRLIIIDPQKPQKKFRKEILPEKDEVLQSVTIAGNRIVAEYMKDASSKAYVYDMDGKFIDNLSLPGIGTMSRFNGEKDENIAFYGFTSFTFPSTIYKYDIEKNESTVYRSPAIDFDADEYETKQIYHNIISWDSADILF